MKDARRIKMQEGRHKKTSFQIYLPLTLFVRFACERMLKTEHKLHILTPLLWPSRCVLLVLLMLGSTPSGVFREPPRSGVAFPTTSGLYCLEFDWQLHRGFSEVPLSRVWPSLPHLVSNPLGVCWQLHRGFSECPLGRVWPSLPHLVSNPLGVCWQLHRGFPRTPSVGCGLPYHIWSLLSGILLTTALGPKLNWVK